MTTVDQFLEALAEVESSNNPEAWGDDGRAMGRCQVHPDALWTYCHRYKVTPQLRETWDHLVRRVLTAFYNEWAQAHEPREIAMEWHLGHPSFPSSADWDADYARKFDSAYARAIGRAIT